MSALPSPKLNYTCYRGRISYLEGSQTYALSSWARFTLGYETVQVHGQFLMPPKLAEDDEVVVAGRRMGDRFHAKACFKPSETPAEASARERGAKLRNYFWWSLLLGSLALLGLLFALRDIHLLLVLGVAYPPVMAFSSSQWVLREAELELALALATDQVEDL